MDPVEVNIGPCGCSHSNGAVPHPDGDVVYMRPRPNLDMGIAAAAAIRQSGSYLGDTNAALSTVYVRFGVTGWNLVDRDGRVPLTIEALLERLEDPLSAGMTVANKGVELYQEAVLAPLAPAKSAPRRPSHKEGSTSRNRASGRSSPTSHSQPSPSAPEAGT